MLFWRESCFELTYDQGEMTRRSVPLSVLSVACHKSVCVHIVKQQLSQHDIWNDILVQPVIGSTLWFYVVIPHRQMSDQIFPFCNMAVPMDTGPCVLCIINLPPLQFREQFKRRNQNVMCVEWTMFYSIKCQRERCHPDLGGVFIM